MGLMRSAGISGLLLLALKLEEVAADATCADPGTFSQADQTCPAGPCTAGDVTLEGLTVVDDPVPFCDGTSDTISFTGKLILGATAANRYDVGLWTGTGSECTAYGFECLDSFSPNSDPFELDGDECADIAQGDNTFEEVIFEVPCAGNNVGDLEIPFCISWQNNRNTQCDQPDGIIQGTDSKCFCSSEVVQDIKVCPDLTGLSVTSTLQDADCVATGASFLIEVDGIPEGAAGEYTIIQDPSGADESVFGTEDLDGEGQATVILLPEFDHTIEVVITFPGTPDNVCTTVTLDLPTCSCIPADEPEDDPCTGDELVCCPTRKVCDDPNAVDVDGNPATICGDPHMTGFLGQKFDFTGEDGEWYSVISDSTMNVNMRITSPVADLPEITYITGLSVLTTDADGFDHSIVIEVADPHNLDSSCPAGVSPCLADGALTVLLDGEESLLAPGTVSLGADVEISAANLPGACRSFGFEKYWERKKLERASQGRRLDTPPSMGEWILGDPTATNMDECVEYVARAEVEEGGLFAHQSEHASFQILTPEATVRLSHGRLHQIAMRDPTDRFDLPDHLTWQMNMAIDHSNVSRDAKGILGQTFVPTRDADGKPIMTGLEAIRGTEEDYRVEGALGVDFVQDAYTS